jgi:hypothetical protein
VIENHLSHSVFVSLPNREIIPLNSKQKVEIDDFVEPVSKMRIYNQNQVIIWEGNVPTAGDLMLNSDGLFLDGKFLIPNLLHASSSDNFWIYYSIFFAFVFAFLLFLYVRKMN